MPATALPLLTELPTKTVLMFEQAEAQNTYNRLQSLDGENRRPIKVLGWMMIHAPSQPGCVYLKDSIDRCVNDDQIFQLGNCHVNYFVNYYQTKTKTRPPSSHPSRPSFEDLHNLISTSLNSTPASHADAKSYALIRDNFRCVLSGYIDYKSSVDMPQLQVEASTQNRKISSTECAHILPSYVNKGIDNDSTRLSLKRAYSAGVWAIAEHYGDFSAAAFDGAGMHNLRNIITLRKDLHDLFDNLGLWFEPIEGTVNQYTLGATIDSMKSDLPAIVTFTSSDPDKLPIPNQQYLAFHAACAQVVSKSGALEYIHKILRELERMQVLREDGTSVELLDSLLSGVSVLVR
ncbi:hypothetical protein BDV93DRAFT_497646 [Ceratobasidium sp. AG-I]|nr:hypothetical protein BDV93DRAFT_497646 [Ceratobasidium sp. AG-I]